MCAGKYLSYIFLLYLHCSNQEIMDYTRYSFEIASDQVRNNQTITFLHLFFIKGECQNVGLFYILSLLQCYTVI